MLMRENEELKSRNEILESQLKTPLDPSKTNAGQTEEKTVDPVVLEELSNNLQTATDVCEKIKQDMDKLKEVHVCRCHTVVVTRNLVKGENKYDIYFLKTLAFISKNKWDKCGALLVTYYLLHYV